MPFYVFLFLYGEDWLWWQGGGRYLGWDERGSTTQTVVLDWYQGKEVSTETKNECLETCEQFDRVILYLSDII